MSKTINISDNAYNTLKELAAKEFRSLTKQFDMVLDVYVSKETDNTPILTIKNKSGYDSDTFYSAEDEKAWDELEDQLSELNMKMSPLESRIEEIEYKEAIGTIEYNKKERDELRELKDRIAPIKKQYDALLSKRNKIRLKD